ncbi:hypothetical protein [Streptomyces olivochromogenes]|uniref:Uncharacterized protein n=2 Tax=Streptomyces olivochromogenes TaxID=1963 RepID=A0A250VKT7_STROL|nr:hypothetical protein [Streptomyces olivochromogenes]GAX54590.1 hypothetical protein SO3561_06142 [Streptomyces olivochromogenes]
MTESRSLLGFGRSWLCGTVSHFVTRRRATSTSSTFPGSVPVATANHRPSGLKAGVPPRPRTVQAGRPVGNVTSRTPPRTGIASNRPPARTANGR